MIIIGLLTNSVISANYGVNALSISNILLIEEGLKSLELEHQYILFGNVEQESQQIKIIKGVDGLSHIDISIVPELEFRKISSFSSFIRNIKKCDLVFDTSGGDSYSDIYGKNRIIHQLVPKWITLFLRKKLILTPQTLGPFESTFWKTLSGWTLKKCEAVFARDHQSYEFCRKSYSLKNLYEVTDMAMVLPYQKEITYSDHSRMRVGLNVSGLLYNGGYTKNNQFGLVINYKSLVEEMIKMILEDLSCDLYLIPHVITTGVESDNEACDLLKEKFPGIHYEGPFKDAIETKSFIAGMDVFLGSRMHSTIGGISSGVPIIPLSYSRKFEGLFGSIGYQECINLKEKKEEEILSQIKSLLGELSQLKDATELSRKMIHEKIDLYRSILKNILERSI